MNRERIYAVVAVLAITLTTSAVMAAPTIDGAVDGAGFPDSYAVHMELLPVGGLNPPDLATDVFLTREGDYLYMAIVLPREYVDNTYSDPHNSGAIYTHPSWVGHGKDGSDQHKFSELEGSDKLGIEIAIGTALGDKIEYLNNTSPYEAEIKSLKDHTSVVTEAATSLQYNLANVPGTWTAHSPELADPVAGETPYAAKNPAESDWRFEVIYEVKMDMTGYEYDFDDIKVTELHASPNKGGTNKMYENAPLIPVPQVAPVPVPGALVMGAMGLGMVGWIKKRSLLKTS